MLTMYEYAMTINDVEFGETYDYKGLFADHFEADKFITENEAVGNTIIINGFKRVKVEPAELDKLYR